MSTVAGRRPAAEAAGWGWAVLAVVTGVLVAVHLVAAVLAVAFGPRGMNLVILPGGALASWWFSRGAWLRTTWGRPVEGTPAPWPEPALTTRRAWSYVWLGAACVVAAAMAIGWQARHWVG